MWFGARVDLSQVTVTTPCFNNFSNFFVGFADFFALGPRRAASAPSCCHADHDALRVTEVAFTEGAGRRRAPAGDERRDFSAIEGARFFGISVHVHPFGQHILRHAV